VHLRFKQAQPKMCCTPKVDGGVEKYFFHFFNPYFWNFIEELETDMYPKILDILI
jgi:hypothetical protein